MRVVVLLAFLMSAGMVAVRVSAQTPDAPTETLVTPTVVATPTATPTPIVASPDEIVFIGELPLPAGTTLRALFRDISSSEPVECGTTATTAAGPSMGLSPFVLAIDASCANKRIGPRICWSDYGCYVHLADRRECTPWDGCPWSDTVAPGNVVTVGYVPVAADDEVAFIGEVPAPAGTAVTVQVADVNTLQIRTCDSTTSADTNNSAVSTFVLRIEANCMPNGLPPRFCWAEGVCDSYTEQTIIENSVAPGITIGIGLLRDRSGEPTPLPGIPNVGGERRTAHHSGSPWLIIALGALLATALATGAGSVALRRARQ